MDCRELKAIMDSYISDELLVETNHDVLGHLENCPDCRREMSDRRALKLQFRHTMKNAVETQIDPIFAARAAVGLREMASRPRLRDLLHPRILALGFACLLLIALAGVFLVDHSTQTEQTQDLPANNNAFAGLAEAIRVSWNEMTSQAVGDHKNCAVEFHLSEKPISLDQAAVKYGAFNKDLDKTVATALQALFKGDTPGGVQTLDAHSCLFEGRRFAHIVLKVKGRVVSVLVTDTDLPTGNDDIQTAHFDGVLNAAGFHLGHHAVFVVSELPDAENMTIARTLAPAIRLHTEKVGA
ncbi:MAG: zf-HC2 domain-containing protein [Acidobacteriota bacterium]